MNNFDLYKYIEKVIKDAYKSEGRKYKKDTCKWFYVVIDNDLIYRIYTPYSRVTSRIEYRLNHNITKNFGFTIEEKYFLDEVLQVNFVTNQINVNGEIYYICKSINYDEMPKGKYIPSGRYEELCRAYCINMYNDFTEEDFADIVKKGVFHLPIDISWESYRWLYHKAFNKYPEVRIRYCSNNVKEYKENRNESKTKKGKDSL